jgi:hypothetical protein
MAKSMCLAANRSSMSMACCGDYADFAVTGYRTNRGEDTKRNLKHVKDAVTTQLCSAIALDNVHH